MAITAFVFVTTTLFSNCFLGDKITENLSEINKSIYASDWYNYSPKNQVFIIPIMRQSQRPFIVSGCSLVTYSLESFKEVSFTIYIQFFKKINFLFFFSPQFQQIRWLILLCPVFCYYWKSANKINGNVKLWEKKCMFSNQFV